MGLIEKRKECFKNMDLLPITTTTITITIARTRTKITMTITIIIIIILTKRNFSNIGYFPRFLLIFVNQLTTHTQYFANQK